jgi:hypothetical protein
MRRRIDRTADRGVRQQYRSAMEVCALGLCAVATGAPGHRSKWTRAGAATGAPLKASDPGARAGTPNGRRASRRPSRARVGDDPPGARC